MPDQLVTPVVTPVTLYVGFKTPNQMLFDKYARHGEGELQVADRANLTISARVYDGYFNGGMRKLLPPYTPAVVLRLTNVQSGESVIVSDWGGDLAAWVITRGTFPDGNYEVNSNIEGTLGFTLQIRNSEQQIPPSKYLVQRPAYMPHMGGFPVNVKTKIIEFKGVRTGDISTPVPFAKGGLFTKPFALNDLWSESFGCNLPDYDGCNEVSTTPYGGLHCTAHQRYSIGDYASVAPDIDGWRAGPKNEAIYDHSPSERRDGRPGTGGAGVVPSGFLGKDGFIYILSTLAIIRVDPTTREMVTKYGWVRKPGTPQPVASGLLPAGVERETWLKQFFEPFVGVGPTISRAWQMCPSTDDDMIVGVADCTNHTIIEIDLRTGIGKVVAGSPGIRGFSDGGIGVALFDQPRGITMPKTGPYAGQWIIADEHTSSIRGVNRLTGVVTTLTRAKRVPSRFPGDFVAELSRKTNRINWGAPTNADGTYNEAFKVQPFDNAQFCHPCHLALMSDGQTIVSVHHDEYRGFKLDLNAKTITHLFDFEGAASRPDVSPKDWPTVHCDTTGSMGYGIDSLWVCSWHYNNMDVRSGTNGAQLFGNFVGPGTCGDHQGIRHNAYSRAMVILGDGSFIFSGDGQNSLCRVRRKLPTDPVIDMERHKRGSDLYRADGFARASVKTQNGSVGLNYFAQFKTPGELAMMSFANRKAYMVANFEVTDWSDENHADVAFYLDANCPLGVQFMRAPLTRPVTMTFDAAAAVVKAGVPVKRLNALTTLASADVKAVDWVKS